MLECATKNGWIQCVEFLQSRCNRTEFENWIAPVRLVSYSDEEAVLEVPNVFVQEYLMENYGSLFREFLPSRLLFTIAEQQKRTPPPPTESLPQQESVRFNASYRFETFVEGPSNQFVKSAALGVATRPGKTYNPLFIHGGVGLGKTHLLHGVGHYVQEHHRGLKVQIITTEAFINDIVDSLRAKSIDRMKRFYRNLDVLLIDDIQFLQNRPNFEEEFCNTFETLINQNKQIVITSDKPPQQLSLSQRMIARMEWGLVAHMNPPDLETRVAIIKNKAECKQIQLTNAVAFFIAEHIYQNVRQLEGAINRLSAYNRFQENAFNIETVERILNELMQPPHQKSLSVDMILQNVAAAFEIRVTDLKSDLRKKEVAFARHVAMYLAKELVSDSLATIGSSFGGKTHSTLIHGWKKICDQLRDDALLKRKIEMIRQNIEKQRN